MLSGTSKELADAEEDTLNRETSREVQSEYPILYPISIAASIILGIVIFWYIYAVLGDHAIASLSDNDLTIVLPCIPLLLAILIPNAMSAERARVRFEQRLAADIGFSYSPHGDTKGLEGTTYVSNGWIVSDMMTGTHRELAVRAFTYSDTHQHSEGPGIKEVVAVTLPFRVPHIVVNAYDLQSPELEPVILEGDFNNTFNLFVEKDRQMEIREVFDPAFMAKFLDAHRELAYYSIEICGSTLTVSCAGVFRSRADFDSTMAVIDILIDALLPKLRAIAEPAANL